MANLFSRLFFFFLTGKGLGIKGGAAGTSLPVRAWENVRPGEHGGPGCVGSGAVPAVGEQPLGQSLCSSPRTLSAAAGSW